MPGDQLLCKPDLVVPGHEVVCVTMGMLVQQLGFLKAASKIQPFWKSQKQSDSSSVHEPDAI